MFDWLNEYKAVFFWIGIASVVMFVGCLIAVPIIVVRLPADYFLNGIHATSSGRKPVGIVLWHVVKNVIGVILLLAGIAMLVLPGQGILTILLSLVFLDIPGKMRLITRILRISKVRQALNWIRTKYNQPPFQFDEPDSQETKT